MSRVLASVSIALALALVPPIGAAARPGKRVPEARTHTIVIDSMRFEPAELTVRAGDTVVWLNKDMFPHTATSKAGGFDSQVIAAGQSWSYKPAAAGAFAYTCTFHPTMNATLRVQ
jgi:plastocyanin